MREVATQAIERARRILRTPVGPGALRVVEELPGPLVASRRGGHRPGGAHRRGCVARRRRGGQRRGRFGHRRGPPGRRCREPARGRLNRRRRRAQRCPIGCRPALARGESPRLAAGAVRGGHFDHAAIDAHGHLVARVATDGEMGPHHANLVEARADHERPALDVRGLDVDRTAFEIDADRPGASARQPRPRRGPELDARPVGQGHCGGVRNVSGGARFDHGLVDEARASTPRCSIQHERQRGQGGHRHPPREPAPAARRLRGHALADGRVLPREARLGDEGHEVLQVAPVHGRSRSAQRSTACCAAAMRRFAVASDTPVVRAISSSSIPSTRRSKNAMRCSAGSFSSRS